MAVDDFSALENFLPAQRLGKCLMLTSGNEIRAAELYHENLRLSQKSYAQLHWFEVGLRNRINHVLSNYSGLA